MVVQAGEGNSFPTIGEFEKQQAKKVEARMRRQNASSERIHNDVSPMDAEVNRKEMAQKLAANEA